jgi:hypothetical protein
MTSPKLHYITVATKPHPVLNRIKERVEIQNESITVLGEQENRNIGWNSTGNFGVKLREVRDYLLRHDVEDDDLILFTDAYDVIYQGNKEEIIRRYLEFSSPIVFGCETTCNPVPSYAQYYKTVDYEFRYLNSGLFIGRAKELRNYVRDYQYNDKDDDQAFWTRKFLYSDDMILDYKNCLFLNTYGVDLSLIKKEGGIFTYKGREPAFIHVNGPDKSELNYFIPEN